MFSTYAMSHMDAKSCAKDSQLKENQIKICNKALKLTFVLPVVKMCSSHKNHKPNQDRNSPNVD